MCLDLIDLSSSDVTPLELTDALHFGTNYFTFAVAVNKTGNLTVFQIIEVTD